MFKTEATALHSLGHHHQIPHLLAYFEEAGKFYLVQQYIQGQTLDKELADDRLWSSGKAIALLRDCLNVLQFIHDKGVIHRDLKPANLIRRHQDKKIVLVDFGTVKNILQGQPELAQLTVAVGTQGYMPIEQARGKPRSTSDLYALGIICIQALTGINPVNLEEDRDGEIAWSHLAEIEPELKRILIKMTRYNAHDRYQSAREVLSALDSINTQVTPSRLVPQSVRQSSTEQIQPKGDPNALPGVRSIAIINRPAKKVKAKLLKPKVWKIALGVIVLTGGIYMSLQASVLKPDPSEVDTIQQE